MKIEVISIYYDCQMEGEYIELLRKNNKPLLTTVDVLYRVGMDTLLEIWWRFYEWEKKGHNEYFCDASHELIIIVDRQEFYLLSSCHEIRRI